MGQIIDREIIVYLEELEKCLVSFRGVRQIWANVAGGGALSCKHRFYPSQEERKTIAEDLMEEQLAQLAQVTSFAARIRQRIADNKAMKRTENPPT